MKNIQVTARLKIHSGKEDEFKRIAAECIGAVKENETGALQYDWFFNPGQTECVVRENYADSDAAMAHLGNVGEFLGQLFAISNFDLEIYGTMSEELKNAVEGLNPKVYSFYKGL